MMDKVLESQLTELFETMASLMYSNNIAGTTEALLITMPKKKLSQAIAMYLEIIKTKPTEQEFRTKISKIDKELRQA